MQPNWEMFGAGLLFIMVSVGLFSARGIASLFKLQVSIPRIIPWTVFVIGILLIGQAFGVFTGLYESFLNQVKQMNLVESLIGLAFIFVVVFAHTIEEKTGYTISKRMKIVLLILGFILILDGVKAIPLSGTISGIIAGVRDALTRLGIYIAAHPYWLVALVFVPIPLIYIYLLLKKKGIKLKLPKIQV